MPADSLNPNSWSLADQAVISFPLTVTPETLIEDAIARMNEAQTSYVLVTEQQRPIGIFTERDFLRLLASGQSTVDVTISTVMTAEVQTIASDQVKDTLALFDQMLQHQIRHLPVVDVEGRLVGIITQSVLLRQRLAMEQTEHQFTKSLNSALKRDQVRLSGRIKSQKVEQQQAEAHIQFQARLLDAVAQAVIATDLEGHILYWNHFAETLYGWSAAEVLGRSILDVTPADTTREQAVEIMTVLRRGEQWSGEFLVQRKDGTSFPAWVIDSPIYDDRGVLVGIVGVSNDISDRKRIEAERQQIEQALQQSYAELEDRVEVRTADLRQAEERWRTLLESVHLAVVGLDCDGQITYANPFLLKLTDYTAAEVFGEDWFTQFLSPSQQPMVKQYFQQLISQSAVPLRYQNTILTRSGEQRIIAWNNTVLHNSQGHVIGTMSIGEDISERFIIDRMKGEFISVVSHELRTPLTAIHGGIKLLAKGLVPIQSDQGQELLQLAAEHSRRLVRLVDDILELERLESGRSPLQKSSFNTQDLTRQVVNLFQLPANQAGITLEVTDPGFEVIADCDRLSQVLTNLIDNAIKFSTADTTIWVTVEPEENASDQNELNHAPTILFSVCDQGRGIPPEKCAKIFERFVQVDSSDSRERGGTGLGLAICQNIIEQHSGAIWVKSTPGEGSRFYFTVPIG
ncbi:MAG: PAS domain S-box protein [Cyanobacteria bacterium P01_F01_bin.13]